jgi:MFS family permease
MRMSATFAALRHRNYRLWFVGQSVSLMGTWMQSVAQGWVVYLLTGSKLALGTISFVGALPTLFLMLPAGAVVDRIPRRRMLIITQIVMMLLAFALAALAATNVLRVWHIGVLAALLGIVTSFDAPARHAMAADMVEDRADLANAIALNSMIFNLARVIGPAVGGFILALVGPAWCFGLNGLTFVAVLCSLVSMRFAAQTTTARRTDPLLQQVGEGLRYVRSNSNVLILIVLSAVSALFGMNYAVMLPAFAADVLQVGETGLGFLNAAIGCGAMAGALLAAWWGERRGRGMLLTIASLVFPAAIIGFSFSRVFALSLGCLAIAGVALVAQNATANTLLQHGTPDALRGRVLSLFMLMFFGTSPFGSLLTGALSQAVGPSGGVGIGAGVALAFALALLIVAPQVRRFEADNMR